jgi:enoyl-CoA hydratase/carnithine racemase
MLRGHRNTERRTLMEATMYTDIICNVEGPVATITLNRPDRLNATTNLMMAELRHALAAAERDASVTGIVITGAGRGFCAGADMAGLQVIQQEGRMPDERDASLEAEPGDRSMGDEFGRGLTYMLTIRKPIIAAINGPCAGYGMSMAMFCDLRFAAEGAIFTTAFAQRGLVAEHGQSWVLPRLIGPSRALDLFWSARRFDANEALQLGVVNRVFPADRLIDETSAYVRALAERCSPTSLLVMKQQVYRSLMQPLGESMRETERLMDESVKRADFEEGIASYMEKRSPEFDKLVLD